MWEVSRSGRGRDLSTVDSQSAQTTSIVGTMSGYNNSVNLKRTVNCEKGEGMLDSGNCKQLAMMKSQTQKLDYQRKRLYEDLLAFRAEKACLEKQLEDKNVCEALFSKWSGIQITRSDETNCHVLFPVMRCERSLGEYTIGFSKSGQYWQLAFHCLPSSVRSVKKRVEELKIQDVDRLSALIHELQHEALMFMRRGEQFNEAKVLHSKLIQMHPSRSTLSCFIELNLCDNYGDSDLTSASVYLTYNTNKFLPDKPSIRCKNNDDRVALDALKTQLSSLERFPLKDALVRAFGLDDSQALAHTSGSDTSLCTSEVAEESGGTKRTLSDTNGNQNVKTKGTFTKEFGSQDDSEQDGDVIRPVKATVTVGRGRGTGSGRGRGRGRGRAGPRGYVRGLRR